MSAVALTPLPARRSRLRSVRAVLPSLGSRLQLVRALLVMVFALSATLFLQLTVVSRLQAKASQQQAYDRFRAELANGTAPIGATDTDGKALALGTSVAFLEIPGIGLRQVVGEGTSAAVLFDGPGHRRDTPLPGQEGVSVVMGRRAAFGGPFGRIASLDEGDVIRVTTGQGAFEYEVIGVRHEGDPSPPGLLPGEARLILVTAAGPPFLPGGVVRVDAALVGDPVVGPSRLVTSTNLPGDEAIMAGDASTLWALALWLIVALGASLAAVWCWHRWGRAKTWVTFLPPLLLIGLSASGEVARLLPNLL